MEVTAPDIMVQESSFAGNQSPCTIVIFGASGDLTQRKLMPALYSLARGNRLPESYAILGYARSEMSDSKYRQKIRVALKEHSSSHGGNTAEVEKFLGKLFYLSGGYDDSEAFQRLKHRLSEIEQNTNSPAIRIFYLATPPNLYGEVIQQLSGAGLASRDGSEQQQVRIVIEKPFGSDLATAQKLNHLVHGVFNEEQVYRIDHYLGKETVQNILVFRFGNAVFEPIWDRRYVDHVQITASENVGVENRGGYYEKAGVVRDMVQNHLLQLLCLIAMEPPVAFSANAVRDERMKVLRSVRPMSEGEVESSVVRGQYDQGRVGEQQVKGYRQEPGVAKDSVSETYAALKLYVENWRWQGVPFYVRSGKRMPRRVTEVAIQFKQPPLSLFRACPVTELSPNVLVLRIQPDEGISLTFEVKPPGPDICVLPVSLDFNYQESFKAQLPDAYETLLEDCIHGDSTLFIRHDWVELAWSLVDPLLRAWEASSPSGFPNYAAGSWGPKEADALIEKDGRRWRRPY